MIPDVSQALSWLEVHSDVLKGIGRGIERETLRVTPDGRLATTDHPLSLGAALTHKWITTDFAESLLEFITPVDQNIDHLLAFLRDIHRHVTRELGAERMWPFSMPCIIESNKDILLAKYGSSNIGRMKALYREGLKNRYGALVQIISGVHYNFSLPFSFWQTWAGIKGEESGKETISAGYLRLIRNYYRFGWILPYLFGASPAVYANFMQGKKSNLPFERNENDMLWLPYATSLRLSDLGYANKSQSSLDITFNTLDSYIVALKKAIKTPSVEYSRIGIKDDNRWLQLNTNILQIENEFYAPIRPKRMTHFGESPSDVLARDGIEYIEVRSLDINPFSPIGIDATQVRFLDLFLIWCTLADAPDMSSTELQHIHKNWNRVILEGRKPDQIIEIGDESIKYPLVAVGKALFIDLQRVAEILDYQSNCAEYQQVCDYLATCFDNPILTCSARILQTIIKNGINETGIMLSEKHQQKLLTESLETLTLEDFTQESIRSRNEQRELERADTLSFEAFLASKNI